MVWRTVVIENPAALSARDNQLRVKSDDIDEAATVPIEDIASLVLHNPQISLTAPLLAKLAAAAATVVVCNDKHTPCGLLVPFGQHSRLTEVLHLQVGAAEPIKKRVWRAVVQQKIRNQVDCLVQLGREEPVQLRALIAKVQSGDTTNVEAQAARLYWPAIFGKPFRRGADNSVNIALNYGYSIIRSAVARGLVARGLLPALGVHHKSKLNGFNLADDFVEPLRPLIDLLVAELFLDMQREFDGEVRRQLIAVGNTSVYIEGEVMSLLRAVEAMASSYVDALQQREVERLALPSFPP